MQTTDVAAAAMAWRQLYLTYSAVFKSIERAIAPTGVTLPQALALATIKSGPHPVTPSRLAQYLTQETQSVTGLIDRMERQAWVRRQRDLPDRRAIRLELTPEGEAKLMETLAPTNDTIDGLFEQLGVTDLQMLAQLLQHAFESASSYLAAEQGRAPGGVSASA